MQWETTAVMMAEAILRTTHAKARTFQETMEETLGSGGVHHHNNKSQAILVRRQHRRVKA
jgi:hypothetical protein